MNIFFLSVNLKENDWLFVPWVFLILFDCTENWISNIGVRCIIPKIIVYVEIGCNFSKKFYLALSGSLS